MKRLIGFVFVCALLFTPGELRAETAGISTQKAQGIWAIQRRPQWCWAANIEFILALNGVEVDQSDIVARTFGVGPTGLAPNWPAGYVQMTDALNDRGVGKQGTRFRIRGRGSVGAPPPRTLINELKNKRPVIIGYQSGPGQQHAVVVTGIHWEPTPAGPVITRIVVRNPWPSIANQMNQGRHVYKGRSLASRITVWWMVRVETKGPRPNAMCRSERAGCLNNADAKHRRCMSRVPSVGRCQFNTCVEACMRDYRQPQMVCERQCQANPGNFRYCQSRVREQKQRCDRQLKANRKDCKQQFQRCTR